jgi:hypothetical protein
MDELPLQPTPDAPCGKGIAQAVATFSLGTLLGACTMVGSSGLLASRTVACCCGPCCGATRSAQLRRIEARRELASLERTFESGGSTPTR